MGLTEAIGPIVPDSYNRTLTITLTDPSSLTLNEITPLTTINKHATNDVRC